MTTVQRVAQIFGWIFVLIAIWGFFVSGGSMDADPETAPRIMGLFPVNILHNLIHLGFGIWGIMAARSFTAAKSYATIAGVIYLVLAVLGFIVPTTFGLVPIGGNDIWLHALLGIVLAGVGFTAKADDEAVAAGRTAEPGSSAAPAAPPPTTSQPARPAQPSGGGPAARTTPPSGGASQPGTTGPSETMRPPETTRPPEPRPDRPDRPKPSTERTNRPDEPREPLP